MSKKLNSKFLSKIIAIMLSVALITSSSSVFAAPNTTTSKGDSITKGGILNEQIAQEGMVLLKNDNGALPIPSGSKLTVFGYASIRPNGGGSSDGGDQSAGTVRLSSDVYSSLKDAGYTVNPTVKQQYTKWTNAVASSGNGYTSDYRIGPSFAAATASGTDFKNSLANYNDAAVVVLSPTDAYSVISLFGGFLKLKVNSGKVLNADAIPVGDNPERAHTFMIDKAQHEMLKYANDNFGKVIVVINTSQNIELGFLNDKTMYPNIKAAILAGEPGANGLNALGQIMNGSVNPSGRTVDTFAKDLTKNPSWVNFGSNGTQGVYATGLNSTMGVPTTPEGNSYIDATGKARAGWFTDYEEGIYVGYRYYETRGYTELQKNPASTWYADNVVYPFGYGLSYTTFTKEVTKTSLAANSTLTKDSIISVDVKVTNTGKVAGKEVVQLYYTAPYKAGGIEKAYVVLGDFAKTDLLAPGASQTVTLKIKASDMASYDWKTDKTYVLDRGTYSIKIMNNSHDLVKSIDYKIASKLLCNTSATGEKITNRFDENNNVILSSNNEKTVLSRNDWVGTWPKVPTINSTDPMKDGRYISDADFKKLSATNSLTLDADLVAPYYSATAPKAANPNTRPKKASVLLQDLAGKSFTDPLWESLLDELSLQEMMDLINNGGFKSIEIPYIGKPYALDTDGPKGWSGSGTSTGANGTGAVDTVFAAAPVIASTWSKDLTYKFGAIIGEQAYWGNSDATMGTIKSYNGWYAPAMNTHRTPLDMRYNEYYSEDGLLAGAMAANVIQGAMSKGVYVTMKHFALHEDGGLLYRGMMGSSDPNATSGLSIWVNEQALREVYLKPFQISVEQGKVQAAMSSLSRIGYTWAGASYPLLTQILRGEWGFKGFVVSDITLYGFENANFSIRSGNDLMLKSGSNTLNQVSTSIGDPATHLTALRRATKNILYVIANSSAMSAPPNTMMQFTPGASGALAAGKAGKSYTSDVSGTITYSNKAKDNNNTNLATTSNTFAVYYTVTAGKLPTGLRLNSSTGVISGTPSAVGTYTFTVSLTVKGITTPTKNNYSIKIAK